MYNTIKMLIKTKTNKYSLNLVIVIGDLSEIVEKWEKEEGK